MSTKERLTSKTLRIVDRVEAAIIWSLGQRPMSRFSEVVPLSTAALAFTGKGVSKETVQNRLKSLTRAHCLEKIEVRKKSFYRVREDIEIEDAVGYLEKLKEGLSSPESEEERERRLMVWREKIEPVLRGVLEGLPVVKYGGVYLPSKVHPLAVYDGSTALEAENELSMIEERKEVLFLYPGPSYFMSIFRNACNVFWKEIVSLAEDLKSKPLPIGDLSDSDRRQLELTLFLLHSLKDEDRFEATLGNLGIASEKSSVIEWAREFHEHSGRIATAYLHARNRRERLMGYLKKHISMLEPPRIDDYARSLSEFRER